MQAFRPPDFSVKKDKPTQLQRDYGVYDPERERSGGRVSMQAFRPPNFSVNKDKPTQLQGDYGVYDPERERYGGRVFMQAFCPSNFSVDQNKPIQMYMESSQVGLVCVNQLLPFSQIQAHLLTSSFMLKLFLLSKTKISSKPLVTNTCKLKILQWTHENLAAMSMTLHILTNHHNLVE